LRLQNAQAEKEIINAQKKREVMQLPNNEPWNNVTNLSHYTGVKSICNLRIQADRLLHSI